MEGQEVETIEFYKIQVMEKDRQISDFEAKMKKVEFKHNRQLKEARAAEERAKGLLKDQKSKVDKISKQAKENNQQNIMLQHRLTELKDDKEKEVADVRAQYNTIKQQMRSYQRILPTHTFLNEIGFKIYELPTYQDLFLNLKQKVAFSQQLNLKLDTQRIKAQEASKTFEQTEQMLRQKKLQAQNNLKEMLPKLIEYEHQINDLKSIIEQHSFQIKQLRDELQLQKQKNRNWEDVARQYESKIQQLGHAFTAEVHNKEDQFKAHAQQEFDRYEQQIKSLSSRLQIKEHLHHEQVNILEEELNTAQSKLQHQRQKYQQSLTDSHQMIDVLKHQVEKQKIDLEQLNQKYLENIQNLSKLSLINSQIQEKIKQQEFKLIQLQKNQEAENKLKDKNIQIQIQDISDKNRKLDEQNKKLEQKIILLAQQKEHLQQQIHNLRNELHLNQAAEQQVNKSLDIPVHIMQFEQKYRKQSSQIDKHQSQLIQMAIQIEELTKEKQKNLNISKQLDQLIAKNQQLKHKNQQNLVIISKNYHRIVQLQTKIKFHQTETEKNSKQIDKLHRQRERHFEQMGQLKEKILSLNKIISDQETALNNSSTKQNLIKAKVDSLQEESKLIAQDFKKQKELVKIQKEQIKNYKQANIILMQKYTKQTKQLTHQLQLHRHQKEKSKLQFTTKQKLNLQEIAQLKSHIQTQQYLKQQIQIINNEKSEIINQKIIHQKKIIELGKQIENMKKQIEKLEEQNLSKDRQNELMMQSLQRQRKDRTLRTVPSLQSLQGDVQAVDEQNFNEMYLMITKKQGEINILNREISDLKEDIESLKITHSNTLQALQAQNNDYLQTIIQMKMKCAQADMKASQKQHLYLQMKKKLQLLIGQMKRS